MRTGLRKLTAAGAVVLVTSLGLAACGSEDTAGGGDTSAVGEDAGVELTEENFFSEVGAAQAEAGSSRVEMSVGVGGQDVTATGDVALGEGAQDTALQLELAMGAQGSLEMRLVEGVIYLNFGPLTENKFAAIDLTDPDNPAAEQYGQLLENVDPAKQLAQLEEAVTGFEEAGEAVEIDGVQAQPYEITLDGAALSGAAGLEGGAGAQVPEEIVYTMFVGPDNLPRRVVADVAGSALQVDYTRWGEDVTVEAPPESEIAEGDPLAQLGGAGV